MASGVWRFEYEGGGKLAIPVMRVEDEDGGFRQEPHARWYEAFVEFLYEDGRVTLVPMFKVLTANFNPEKE